MQSAEKSCFWAGNLHETCPSLAVIQILMSELWSIKTHQASPWKEWGHPECADIGPWEKAAHPGIPFLSCTIDFIFCYPFTAKAFLHLQQQLQAGNVGCKCLCWKVQDILGVYSFSSGASSLPSYSLVIFLPVCVPMSQPTVCRSVFLMGIEDLIHS